MHECDLDTSVPDWIIEYPGSLAVFQEFGIEYTCGGKSLRFVCEERGVSAEHVLARIRQLNGPTGSVIATARGRRKVRGHPSTRSGPSD